MPSAPKIYATLKKRYTIEALIRLRFTREGSQMLKRGGRRTELAVAQR